MDFGNAAILILAVYGLTEFGKRFLGGRLSKDPRIVAGLALLVGQAAVWLVATTAWAHEQVIGTKPLDELNSGSKILVGLFAAGVAAFGSQFLGSLANMGQNQLTEVQKNALDLGAQRLVDASLNPNAGGTHPSTTAVDPSTFRFKDDG